MDQRHESAVLHSRRFLLTPLAIVCALASPACVAPQPGLPGQHVRFIDLTHAFGKDTLVWPTEEPFVLLPQYAEDMPAGYFYASNRLTMPEHGGTHIDAPIHFSRGGQTLDQVPLDRLIGTGVRIDATALCAEDRDYRITIQDFERWEATHGRIPDAAIVLLQTGFARYWPARIEYLGTELRGSDGVRALRFPGLHPQAADWLIRERRVKAVGIDTASIDYGRSTRFETHVALLSNNVPVFENLGDLSGVPVRGFDVIALPMKIAGATGGPLRIIAIAAASK